MAVFDREGVFILKIDRMLYGFYYFTSCPVGLLCLKVPYYAKCTLERFSINYIHPRPVYNPSW